MAEDLDYGEFCLPSQFLTDDDILMEKKNLKNNSLSNRVYFPFESPYGFGSFGSSTTLSSPVESVVSSTETESDDEDYIAGLTRQIVHSTLQEDEKSFSPVFSSENPKTWVSAGSPQSTLSAVGSWSGCSTGSSRESPNGPSQVSSPLSTPMNGKEDPWDLLYAAAGQVVRMKMNNESPKYYHGRGILDPPRKPSSVSAPVKNPNVGFYSNQAITHQQLQRNQFQQLKQQQLMKQQCSAVWGRQAKVSGTTQQHQNQQLQNRARTGGVGNGRCGRSLSSSSSAWPSLQQQQQAGSGMRAVFLGGSGSSRESCGTGVFLPRRSGNPSDSRKKPACSTVLLPERVVQALNLNLDNMGAQPRFNGGFLPEHDVVMARKGDPLLLQQKRNLRPQPAINHEMGLPHEWTY